MSRVVNLSYKSHHCGHRPVKSLVVLDPDVLVMLLKPDALVLVLVLVQVYWPHQCIVA